MSQLTFADLINRRVPLAAPEAAALTLAVARVLDSRRITGGHVRLPDDEWILLSSSGDVSIVEVLASAADDETARLSALLRRLLHLDDRHTMPDRGLVPGGLMIVLARNLGHIHLPGTGPVAFRDALERFAVHDPAALSAVFWRAASVRAEASPRTSRSGTPAAAQTRDERRRRGLSPSESRRVIRDLERELFELRSQPPGQPAAAPQRPASILSRRLAMAAGVAASFTGIIAIAALALTGSAPGVQPSVAAIAPTAIVQPEPTSRPGPGAGRGPARSDGNAARGEPEPGHRRQPRSSARGGDLSCAQRNRATRTSGRTQPG